VKPPIAPWQVWLVNFEPVKGREQAGTRPAIVVGSDDHCRFPAEMGFVVPLTTRNRGLSHHVRIDSPSSGLREPSWALVDQLRALSTLRFVNKRPMGTLSGNEREEVGYWVHRMLAR